MYYKVKKYGKKWLLYGYNLVELEDQSIKLFNTYHEAIAERDKRNSVEFALRN